MTDTIDERDDRDDDLSAAARTLHREWESPRLWDVIAAEIAAEDRRRTAAFSWRFLAAAAVLLLTVGVSVLWVSGRLSPVMPAAPAAGAQRLLTDEALSQIEHAEAQYIGAIDALAATAAPKIDSPDAPLLANLRERLLAIDAAIADCRAEIERNRFNAHLRRQLLTMYQEKRRTLEQILEYEPHVM